jgi:hypothetical protein
MITIVSQPTTGKLMAAYRPIIIEANIAPVPPVAYCDIYINGTLYKTISKTQAPFEFDIQDACQEYIKKYLPSNGGSIVENDILHQVYCKIRSSQFDTNGFIQPDANGTNSSVFWAVNAALQHEDNQDLESHLGYFKNGTWANNVYPLTHRPNDYKLCKVDSDFFPVVNKGNTISCIRLNYRLKGQTNFQVLQNCSANCTPVTFTLSNPLPNASINVLYTLNINLAGTGPFVYVPVTMPPWLNGVIVGNVLTLSGTPPALGVEDVEFEVTNCSGNSLQGFNGTIQTQAITCGVTLSGVGLAVSSQPPSQPYYIYWAWWTNNGGTLLYVDIEISFDNGATWQSPNNGAQASNTDWYYDLGSTLEQAHQVRLTPYCAVGNPGVPTIATYTPSGICPAPVLTGVQFDSSNNIILSWINNGAWLAITPEYSYDTVSWFGISTGSPISPRNIGTGLNNTGVVYFRLTGQCNSGSSLVSNSISFDTNIVSGGNIQIINSSIPGSYISDVTPAFFVVNMGSYPVLPNQQIDGTHGGYNGDITVQATGNDPNDTLELFINGNFIQSVYVGAMSGLFTFVNVNINSNDNVVIRLLNF